MTDSNEENTEPWLLATFRQVQRAVLEANDATALRRRLPDAVVRADGNRFAWLAAPHRQDNKVRVLASASGPELPETVGLGGEGSTAQALASSEVLTHDTLGSNREYQTLQDHGVPDASAGVSIPLSADQTAASPPDSVLHLYTEKAVTGMVPGVMAELGETVVHGRATLTAEHDRERARRRLEQLRSAVSHDFGNPVNLASGRLELASEECDSRHLESATEALEQLDSLIETNLRYVEVGKPPRETETVSVAALGRDCWEGGGELVVAGDRELRADSERVRTILYELFENAREHSESEIEVTIGPVDGGFYVADDGPGIPADEREYVFDRGYTTDPDREGAGLAVVRESVQAHGWQIRLDETNEGARFEILTDRW